jgi:hypothetical protein
MGKHLKTHFQTVMWNPFADVQIFLALTRNPVGLHCSREHVGPNIELVGVSTIRDLDSGNAHMPHFMPFLRRNPTDGHSPPKRTKRHLAE